MAESGIAFLEQASQSSVVGLSQLLVILELHLRLKLTSSEAAALVCDQQCLHVGDIKGGIDYIKFLVSLKRIGEQLRSTDKNRRRREQGDADVARQKRLEAVGAICSDPADKVVEPCRQITQDDLKNAVLKIAAAAKHMFKHEHKYFTKMCASKQSGPMNASMLRDFIKKNLRTDVTIEESNALIGAVANSMYVDTGDSTHASSSPSKVITGVISLPYFIRQLKFLGLSRRCDFSIPELHEEGLGDISHTESPTRGQNKVTISSIDLDYSKPTVIQATVVRKDKQGDDVNVGGSGGHISGDVKDTITLNNKNNSNKSSKSIQKIKTSRSQQIDENDDGIDNTDNYDHKVDGTGTGTKFSQVLLPSLPSLTSSNRHQNKSLVPKAITASNNSYRSEVISDGVSVSLTARGNRRVPHDISVPLEGKRRSEYLNFGGGR